MRLWLGLIAVVAVAGALGAGACGGGSKDATPCTGKERCACYPNLSCNTGLMCLSNLCVSLGGSGTGGAVGSGGATTGSGGARVGSGGMTTTGSGGATTGSGGATTGSGGVTGSGGATTGSGGATTGSGGATTGSGGSSGGTNLIKNGDFSRMKEYWDLTSNTPGTLYYSYSTGEYCIYNMSSSSFLSFSLGYPPTPSDAFVIEPGASYTLSYRADAVDASIEVKIGHAEIPYTPVYSVTDTIVFGSQTHTHLVSSAVGDTGAGLVFNGTLLYDGQVCFDDVMFFKN